MKSSFEMLSRSHAWLKSGAMLSANSLGLVPAASAACWIFRPCSSVPVRKYTSSPSMRCHRASASLTIVVYAWPRCGFAFT